MGFSQAEIGLIAATTYQGLTAGAGGPGSPDSVQWVAGEDLSGERVVCIASGTEVKYADKDRPSDKFLVLGLTMYAASLGEIVRVRCSGIVTDPSWAWSVGDPVFLGSNGMLTQTPPSTGFSLQVGVAASPTAVFIGIRTPIEMA